MIAAILILFAGISTVVFFSFFPLPGSDCTLPDLIEDWFSE